MSRDGDLDCSAHTDAELDDAIRGMDRTRYPLNYAKLLAEREAREARRPPPPPVRPEVQFPVHYTPIPRTTGQFDRGTNSLRLRGQGRIVITDRGLELHGRRSQIPLLGRQRTFLAVYNQICNVEVFGRAVRFLAEPDAESDVRGIVTIWAATSSDAAELTTRLPERRTADFQPTLEEEQQFAQALLAATPTVTITPTLVAVTTLLFVVIFLVTSGAALSDARVLLNWGSNFVPLTASGEWYRLLTSVFLHLSIAHILLNMLVLRDVGPLVERLFGSGRFLMLYLLAGIGGSLLSAAVAPLRHSVGASGAIFGVYGAFAAFLVLHRHAVPARIMKTYTASTTGFLAASLSLGFISPNVDNAAHLGGLAAGFIGGLALARPIPREAKPSLAKRMTAPLAVALGAMALVSFATHLVVQRHQRYYPEMELERVVLRFYHEERIADEYASRLIKSGRSDMWADSVFVYSMEANVLPFWRESLRRLRTMPRPNVPVHRARYERLLWVADNRVRAYELMVAGARRGHVEELRRGQTLLEEGTRRVQRFLETGEFK